MAEEAAAAEAIRIEVVCAWSDRILRRPLTLPTGSTAAAALAQVPWRDWLCDTAAMPKIGIFGRPVKTDHVLQHGDRLELYRPLQAEPRELRRQQARSAR